MHYALNLARIYAFYTIYNQENAAENAAFFAL